MTSIEWTQRPGTKGETWNPLAGCSILSPGCTHCYAMKMAHRIQAMGGKAAETYAGTTRVVNGHPVWTGKINVAPDATLLKPLRWREPRTVFVNSMSDLFHESVPDGWIMTVLEVIYRTPQHTYIVLTKRSTRMRSFFERWTNLDGEDFSTFRDARGPESTRAAHPSGRGQIFASYLDTLLERSGGKVPDGAAWPTFDWMQGPMWWPDMPRNLWLGVSAERQQEADERIPDLLATPAAIRFVSAEPLLGPIDLTRLRPGNDIVSRMGGFRNLDALRGAWFVDGHPPPEDEARDERFASIDWIIVGGESGPGARPMHPAWARSIRDQCHAAGTAFFFKQWGNWVSTYDRDADDPDWRRVPKAGDWDRKRFLNRAGGQGFHGEELNMMENVGKSRAGRLLDGVEHNAWPAGHN